MNELTKKLYTLDVGKQLLLKNKKGDVEGTFIRVPSGWIYRYTLRNSSCCCFISYSEDIQQWDEDLVIHKCHFCNSKNVFVIVEDKKFKINCSDCGTTTKKYDTKNDAVSTWNSIKLEPQKTIIFKE
jgi:hypothetical protein